MVKRYLHGLMSGSPVCPLLLREMELRFSFIRAISSKANNDNSMEQLQSGNPISQKQSCFNLSNMNYQHLQFMGNFQICCFWYRLEQNRISKNWTQLFFHPSLWHIVLAAATGNIGAIIRGHSSGPSHSVPCFQQLQKQQDYHSHR